MTAKGKLKLVSLKEKGDGERFIEIKILAEFSQSLLADLGKMFAQYVNFEIESLQPDLDLEDDAAAREREIEALR